MVLGTLHKARSVYVFDIIELPHMSLERFHANLLTLVNYIEKYFKLPLPSMITYSLECNAIEVAYITRHFTTYVSFRIYYVRIASSMAARIVKRLFMLKRSTVV